MPIGGPAINLFTCRISPKPESIWAGHREIAWNDGVERLVHWVIRNKDVIEETLSIPDETLQLAACHAGFARPARLLDEFF